MEQKKAIFYDFDLTLTNIHVFNFLNSSMDVVKMFIEKTDKYISKLNFPSFNDPSMSVEISFSNLPTSCSVSRGETFQLVQNVRNKIVTKIIEKINDFCILCGKFKSSSLILNELLDSDFEKTFTEEEKPHYKKFFLIVSKIVNEYSKLIRGMKIPDNKLHLFSVQNIKVIKKMISGCYNDSKEEDKQLLINMFFDEGKLDAIKKHFEYLKSNDVDIYLSSFGIIQQLEPILKIIGLYDYFKNIICRSIKNQIVGEKHKLIDLDKMDKVKGIFEQIINEKYNHVVYVDDDPRETLKMLSGNKFYSKCDNVNQYVKNCKISFFGNSSKDSLSTGLLSFFVYDKIESLELKNNIQLMELTDFNNGLKIWHFESIENIMFDKENVNISHINGGGANYYSKYLKYKHKYAMLKKSFVF